MITLLHLKVVTKNIINTVLRHDADKRRKLNKNIKMNFMSLSKQNSRNTSFTMIALLQVLCNS